MWKLSFTAVHFRGGMETFSQLIMPQYSFLAELFFSLWTLYQLTLGSISLRKTKETQCYPQFLWGREERKKAGRDVYHYLCEKLQAVQISLSTTFSEEVACRNLLLRLSLCKCKKPASGDMLLPPQGLWGKKLLLGGSPSQPLVKNQPVTSCALPAALVGVFGYICVLTCLGRVVQQCVWQNVLWKLPCFLELCDRPPGRLPLPLAPGCWPFLSRNASWQQQQQLKRKKEKWKKKIVKCSGCKGTVRVSLSRVWFFQVMWMLPSLRASRECGWY